MGGKKPKRGMLTGGYGTITIGNGGKFGIKSKKCLKMGNRDIQIVRGEFINNIIEVILLSSIYTFFVNCHSSHFLGSYYYLLI